MRVGFLGLGQDRGERPAGGYLRKEDADRLVAELAAERITQKLIRALPPNSFRSLSVVSTPKKLTGGEIGNCRYFPPSGFNWQNSHGRAIRSVQVRAGMTMKAWLRTA